MRNATLLFLLKTNGTEVTDICLAMKKRGFGAGRWNGAGGKVEEGETIEDAVKRETKEELNIVVSNIEKVAEISFTFSHKPDWNQKVHVYMTFSFDQEPTESEEMSPKWFPVKDIPYHDMWPDDIFWLPRVLEGKHVQASFTLGEGDVILDHQVEETALV